jgi:dipeptidyl aminopeptidase/acylaminoacyl peptidase
MLSRAIVAFLTSAAAVCAQDGALDINHNNEIYWLLTDCKIPVEYVIYPREPYDFTEPEHQRDVMDRNLRWFMHWLK